jgi:hypothetical protein
VYLVTILGDRRKQEQNTPNHPKKNSLDNTRPFFH